MSQKSFLVVALLLAALGCQDDTEEMTDMRFRGPGNPPTLGLQIDRVGRAATATGLIEAFNGDSSAKGNAKDRYNTGTPEGGALFAAQIASSLAILDALDETCGNQLVADVGEERYSFLAGVLADDQLYVDSTREVCGTYLGLEAEIVGAISPGTGGCGGRMLDDDVIERIYSVLALGALDGFDDTIAANDADNSSAFPFLAAPH